MISQSFWKKKVGGIQHHDGGASAVTGGSSVDGSSVLGEKRGSSVRRRAGTRSIADEMEREKKDELQLMLEEGEIEDERDIIKAQTVLALSESLKMTKQEISEIAAEARSADFKIAVSKAPPRAEDADSFELEMFSIEVGYECRNNAEMLMASREFFVFVAAANIQRVFRGHLHRTVYKRKDHLRQEHRRHVAAQEIQRKFRGMRGRVHARRVEFEDNLHFPSAAAVQIQRIARGFLVRLRTRRARYRIATATVKFDQTRGNLNLIVDEEDVFKRKMR